MRRCELRARRFSLRRFDLDKFFAKCRAIGLITITEQFALQAHVRVKAVFSACPPTSNPDSQIAYYANLFGLTLPPPDH
jgi:hypothetical protein